MARGTLDVGVTDLSGASIGGRVDFDLEPLSGETGTGGDGVEVSIPMGEAVVAAIGNVPCRGGPGTMYRVQATTPHYRTYSFFQLIQDRVNPAADDIEFWVKPGDVRDIRAPKFGELAPHLRKILMGAAMVADKPEDKDLVGRTGADLYDGLGALRKACLLNLAKKCAHVTAAKCFPTIGPPMVCRQDRIFAMVSEDLLTLLHGSSSFVSAPATLHKPLAGFSMTGVSFKSRDAHANLQITFQRHTITGRLAADIDIDEASGIKHGFEVIRNATFKSRTNPYLIREFLLSADPVERTLDPDYRFAF